MGNNLIAGNFFKQNPDKVLGEAYETSGRFGKVTKYEGDLTALDKIDVKLDFMPKELYFNPLASTSEQPAEETVTDAKRKENFSSAVSKSNTEIVKKSKKKALQKSIYIEPVFDEQADLISFREMFERYRIQRDKDGNKIGEITLEELNAFAYWKNNYTDAPMKGEWIKSGLVKEPSDADVKRWVENQMLCYYKGDLLPKFLYVAENIYEKKSRLETDDKDDIIKLYGEKVYERQHALLMKTFEEQFNNRLRIGSPDADKRLIILPTSEFAKNFTIKSLQDEIPFKVKLIQREKDRGKPDFQAEAEGKVWRGRDRELIQEMNLINAFRLWLVREKDNIKFTGMSNYKEVLDYMRGASRPKDMEKEDWSRIMSRAKNNAERLFMEFLSNNLKEDDKDRLEIEWNAQFNSYVKPDYDKVPVAFRVGKMFRGEPFEMRWEKREAVAFMTVENTGCVAYGVGYGKTLSSIFTMLQFMDAGWCKRPLVVVPNQTYKQWISEIKNSAPHIKINDLYNLRDQYQDELKGKGGKVKPVEEYSISVMTFEGFEMLSFNRETESALKSRLFDILSQQGEEFSTGKGGEKEKARMMEKIEYLMGKGQKMGMVSIEDLGIDFFCMDEAHNAKKIFTRVQSKDAESEGGRKRQEYKIQSGTPSDRGLKAFMVAHYIMHNNHQRNVMLLTATPFTNSPLEVFSMLALVAWKKLEQMGLANLNNFFDNYIEVKDDLVINAQLKPVRKQVVKGFNNLKALQQLIYRFINFKDADLADAKGRVIKLVRPNKIVIPYDSKMVDGVSQKVSDDEKVQSILPLSPLQAQLMKDIIAYAEGDLGLNDVCKTDEEVIEGDVTVEAKDTTEEEALNEANLDKDEKVGVRMLRAVNFARNLALSPYLYKCSGLTAKPTYKEYIETSNKLKYIMECVRSVKEYHESRKEPVSGQIIYMDRGVDYFPLIKEYLVKEVGYKEHEIGIIKSTMSESDLKGINRQWLPKYTGGEKTVALKTYIQNLFLGKYFDEASKDFKPLADEDRVKIIIGSSTIREGLNLQEYTTVLYNAFVDWNPTDFAQLAGRAWRQGNRFKNIRIVVPLMENSMDIFIFQKLSEKTNRINAIWNLNGKTNVLNLEEFNPDELKYEMIKDPKIIAQMQIEDEKLKMADEKAEVEAEMKTLKQAEELNTFITNNLEDLVKEAEAVRKSKIKNHNPEHLIALIQDAIKTQKDDKGVKFEKREDLKYDVGDKGYRGQIVMGEDWREGIYEFDQFRGNWRKLNQIKDKILKPRKIEVKDIEKHIAKYEKEIEKIEAAISKLDSKENLEERIEEVIAEQKRKKIVTKPMESRVKEFKTLNYLLSEKQAKQADKPAIKVVPKQCPPADEKGIPRIDAEALAFLEECIAGEGQSKDKYFDYNTLTYTPERQKLHDEIVGRFMDGTPCVVKEPPIALLTGGVPASGKTHWLKHKADLGWLTSKNVFHIDADAVRSMLPEYKGWNANNTHEETKDITKQMINTIGHPCKYDLVFDGTMNSGRNYIPLIERIKKLGYKVFMVYVKVPSYEIAWKRALERYQRTGRFVPKEVFDEAWKNGEKTFREIRELADGWILVDGVTSKMLEKGGEEIPKTRNYVEIAKEEVDAQNGKLTTIPLGSEAPADADKERKLKIAKAKAKAQAQRVKILALAGKGGAKETSAKVVSVPEVAEVEMGKGGRLNVLSPDGFPLTPDETYANKKEAEKAIEEWMKRFQHQGYYSSMKGRIPLDELRDYMKIVPAGEEMTEGLKMMRKDGGEMDETQYNHGGGLDIVTSPYDRERKRLVREYFVHQSMSDTEYKQKLDELNKKHGRMGDGGEAKAKMPKLPKKKKKPSAKEVNKWFGQLPFEAVEKITGVDMYGAELSSDEKIKFAHEVWGDLSISAKRKWYDEMFDEYAQYTMKRGGETKAKKK